MATVKQLSSICYKQNQNQYYNNRFTQCIRNKLTFMTTLRRRLNLGNTITAEFFTFCSLTKSVKD
jgi:hypothetical protein